VHAVSPIRPRATTKDGIFSTVLAGLLVPCTFAQDQTAPPTHEQPSFDPVTPDEIAKPQTPVTAEQAKPAVIKPADKSPAPQLMSRRPRRSNWGRAIWWK
jgi:hypothetical protein